MEADHFTFATISMITLLPKGASSSKDKPTCARGLGDLASTIRDGIDGTGRVGGLVGVEARTGAGGGGDGDGIFITSSLAAIKASSKQGAGASCKGAGAYTASNGSTWGFFATTFLDFLAVVLFQPMPFNSSTKNLMSTKID